jgi:hypothetical protein
MAERIAPNVTSRDMRRNTGLLPRTVLTGTAEVIPAQTRL